MSTTARARLGLALAILSASVGTSAANVALPALVRSFDAPQEHVQWVVLAYLITMTAASVVAGSLGDRWGRRRVLATGITVFTIAAAVGALAPSLPVLIVARGAQGVGAAVMTALPLALARDLSTDDRTGRVMGLLGTTSAIGTALGPALGGALIGWGGWAAAFWMMVPLGAAALLLAATLPASGPASRPRRGFDATGSVLLTAGITGYALALTAPASGWPIAPLMLGAVALLGGFVAVERRVAHPVLPLETLRHRPIANGMIANVLVATVMMTTLVVGPYTLHDGLGLAVPLVGLVMAVGPVTSAVTGVLAGRLVDRISPSKTTAVGLTVMTAGAASLAVLPAWCGAAGYIVALLVLTPGYQLFLAATNSHVLTSADPAQRGTIAGALGLSRNLGLITGASAMSALYAAFATPTGTAAGSLDATRVTFLTAALLATIAAGASLLAARAPAASRTAIR
nr:MFS transporter [Microbacterium testaceum]